MIEILQGAFSITCILIEIFFEGQSLHRFWNKY